MTIRAVFFDLDDTLIETRGTFEARAELAAACIARDRPHLSADNLTRRFLAPDPRFPSWPVGVTSVLQELALHETPAGREALRLWSGFGCEYLVASINGVMEAIAAFAPEVVLGVITNGPEASQRNKLEQLDLRGRVNVFMTSERARFEKPNPRIFQLALAEAGVAPQEAVFIGDIVDVDVAGALAAGMHAIHFDRGIVDTKSVDPARYHRLESYAGLPAVLRTLDEIEP